MSDYLPIFLPGSVATLTTSGAVTGGQLLAVSGSGTVAPAAAGAANYIGVAAGDAPSGGRVAFYPRGVIHETVADGDITAGGQLQTGATGKIKALAAASGNAAGDINAARSAVGVALTTGTDTNSVRWMAW
ncbi:hypothetical protein [Streptosporangium sp. NPDC049078]|uniref:hypothetical protein n=1 Tax=Streptosporangium sp. NPDC049078 TaxID=3155767 RepID=UPI0034266FCB